MQMNQVNINRIHKNQYRVVQHFLQVKVSMDTEKERERERKQSFFFLKANIQFNDHHYNEVIRVLPLRAAQ